MPKPFFFLPINTNHRRCKRRNSKHTQIFSQFRYQKIRKEEQLQQCLLTFFLLLLATPNHHRHHMSSNNHHSKATMEQRRINDFDEGWKRIEIGITKLIRNVEGLPDTQFSSDEYMMLYTTIYDLGYRHGFSQNLYDKCKETIDEFNRSNVLPFLSGKLDELLLRELVQRMLMHKAFVTRLSHLFAILEQTKTRSLPPLNQLGLSSFRDVVFMEVHANATKAVIDLIRKDRAGEQIDKLLLKNVIDIFVEIDMGDIELLDETANDYKLKAEPKPPAKTCETMVDIKGFKKSIEGLITLNYVKKDKGTWPISSPLNILDSKSSHLSLVEFERAKGTWPISLLDQSKRNLRSLRIHLLMFNGIFPTNELLERSK